MCRVLIDVYWCFHLRQLKTPRNNNKKKKTWHSHTFNWMVKLKIETRLSYHWVEYRESNVFIAFLYCWPISLRLTLLMCNGTMSGYSHKWLNPLLSTLNHLIFSSNFWAIIIKFSGILLLDKFKLLRLVFYACFH